MTVWEIVYWYSPPECDTYGPYATSAVAEKYLALYIQQGEISKERETDIVEVPVIEE